MAVQPTFEVLVPDGVQVGQTFQVTAPSGIVVPVIVPEGAGPGTCLAIPTPSAPTSLGAAEPAAPVRFKEKVRINTLTVDGMRGFAVMHIIIGHLFLFSDTRSAFFPHQEDAPSANNSWAWPADAECPVGWGLTGGRCFYANCEPLSWEEADKRCAEMVDNARLASFKTSEDLGKVLRHFSGGEAWHWVGYNERKNKGTWVWADGSAADVDFWQEGEPNDHNGNSEECAFTQGRRPQLLDAPCAMEVPYICSVVARESGCGATACKDDNTTFWTTTGTCNRNPMEGAEGCDMGFIALMGGGSMGFFYIISGFVMVVGYAQLTLRPPRECKETVCGTMADKLCCFCCSAGEGEEGLDDLPVLDTRGFLRKRCARLAPMYYLTALLGVMVPAIAIGNAGQLDVFRGVLTLFGATSWALTFPMENGLLWTVSTMMFFYLCFPALAPRIQRFQPKNLRAFALGMYGLQFALFFFGMIALGFVMPANAYWIRMYPPVRLPIFVMGMCCGFQRLHAEHARKEGKEQPSECCPVIQPLAGCGCCHPVTGLAFYWLIPTLLFSAATFACSGSMVFLRALLEMVFPILFYDWVYAATDPDQQGSPLARFFSSRFMVFLGDISMSMYMVHMLVALAVGFALGLNEPLGKLPVWAPLVVIPISALLGWFLTRFFETPVANLLRPTARKRPYDRDAEWSPAPELVGAPVSTQGGSEQKE